MSESGSTALRPLQEQIEQANASGRTPVFIHGLWLLDQQLGSLGRALRPGRLRTSEPGLA